MRKSSRPYKVVTLKNAIRQLELLRGRARKRILGHEDLLEALNEARLGAYGLRAGASVPGSYGYPAKRMRLVAIKRQSGSYAVLVDWAPAHGRSVCPLGGRRQVWQRKLEAAKSRLPAAAAANKWLVIPARIVHIALAAWLQPERRRAELSWLPLDSALASVHVRREDSLSVGHCPDAIDFVASWWPRGTVSVPASELRKKILQLAPNLARYAQEAIHVAARRQGVIP